MYLETVLPDDVHLHFTACLFALIWLLFILLPYSWQRACGLLALLLLLLLAGSFPRLKRKRPRHVYYKNAFTENVALG